MDFARVKKVIVASGNLANGGYDAKPWKIIRQGPNRY